MTPTSPESESCHDSVIVMTGKGTTRHTIRMDDELWKRLGEAAERAGTDRSTLLREFARWWLGDPAAKLPDRDRRT